MEFALILRELWSRKWLVAAGAVVALFAAVLVVAHVSLFPPSLKSRSLSYASARTQVIVDSPDSSLADLRSDVNPLIVRAGVYSRVLTSPGALQIIGREAGIDPGLIFAQGPFEIDQPRAEQEPTAEARSSQIVGEGDEYRLRYESSPSLPIVTIFAQAPTTDEANRLADGAARGLSAYVDQLETRNAIPEKRRVAIRQLGEPSARPVNEGVGKKVAVLVFGLVFVVWCAGILIVSRLIAGWKASGEVVQLGEDAAPHPAPVAVPVPAPEPPAEPKKKSAAEPKPAKRRAIVVERNGDGSGPRVQRLP